MVECGQKTAILAGTLMGQLSKREADYGFYLKRVLLYKDYWKSFWTQYKKPL